MATKKKTIEEVVESKTKKSSAKETKIEKFEPIINGTGKTWAELEAEHSKNK